MKINEIVDNQIPVGMISSHGEEDATNIISLIEKNCSEVLSFIKQSRRLLYRGVDTAKSIDFGFIGKSTNERPPLSSPRWLQEDTDFKLLSMGFKALRSNSIFCVADNNIARGYGTVFAIFPFNGFSFTWSEVLSDLYVDLYQSNSVYTNLIQKMHKMSPETFVENYKFNNTDMVKGLKSRHEILISGKYIAINADYLSFLKPILPEIMNFWQCQKL